MNKIFELAKQADLIQWDTLPSGAKTPDYESVVKAKKFAELIVGECIRKIEDIAESSNNPQPIYRVAVDLLEHFGVKE
jgi:hypothetical protein